MAQVEGSGTVALAGAKARSTIGSVGLIESTIGGVLSE
jgi:hypothetical protein